MEYNRNVLATSYLWDTYRRITRNYDYKFVPICDELGNGDTLLFNGKLCEISIAMPSLHSDSKFSHRDLTTMVVSLYHEIGHAKQITKYFEKDNDLSKVLALSHFAKECALYYYDYGELYSNNYEKIPCEMAAQYYGLKKSYLYLADRYNESFANELICDYVNNGPNCTFIDSDKKYDNVEDIFTAYNDRFNEIIHEHRHFFNNYSEFYNEKSSNDTYSCYAHAFGDGLSVYLNKESTDGLMQDAILSAIYAQYCSDDGNRKFASRILKQKNVNPTIMLKPVIRNIVKPKTERVNLDDLLDIDETNTYEHDIDEPY